MGLSYLKLFFSFREEIELLTMEERGRLLTAMLDYAQTGALPGDLLTGSERILFPVCRQRIDRDGEAYDRKCQLNRANGAKGGRPAKNRTVFSETEKTQDKEEGEEEEKEKEKEKIKEEGEEKDQGEDDAIPTLEQVLERCRTDAPSVNGERFFQYYQAVGWRIGGRRIVDWRAKLRDWELGNREGARRYAPEPVNPALNYMQREYREEDFGDDFYFDLSEFYPDAERSDTSSA